MRFDHVLWVTPDLDATAQALAGLGLHVSERGEHPGQGTRNHCIHFGLAYIELIHVWNAAMAQATGLPLITGLVEAQRRGERLYTFALAVKNLDRIADALQASGVSAGPLLPGSRIRADGTVVR